MVDPRSLLQVAERLARPVGRGPRSGATLRRAVSTAYYALFHLLAGQAAEGMFRNEDERRRFGPTAFRSFQHAAIRKVVEGLQLAPAQRSDNLQRLGLGALSPDLNTVCGTFVTAQQQRELADYDVGQPVRPTEVIALLQKVGTALDAWDRARNTPEARELLIALLLFGRGAR